MPIAFDLVIKSLHRLLGVFIIFGLCMVCVSCSTRQIVNAEDCYHTVSSRMADLQVERYDRFAGRIDLHLSCNDFNEMFAPFYGDDVAWGAIVLQVDGGKEIFFSDRKLLDAIDYWQISGITNGPDQRKLSRGDALRFSVNICDYVDRDEREPLISYVQGNSSPVTIRYILVVSDNVNDPIGRVVSDPIQIAVPDAWR